MKWGSSFAGRECSRVGLSFIQHAHDGFCFLGRLFVERASDLRHWQPPIAEAEKGAVKSQAAIRRNDTRRPWAREFFGAVPSVAPVAGAALS